MEFTSRIPKGLKKKKNASLDTTSLGVIWHLDLPLLICYRYLCRSLTVTMFLVKEFLKINYCLICIEDRFIWCGLEKEN